MDSFGTEAEFNFGKFSETDKKYKSLWGILDLNLRQFMTMFRTSFLICTSFVYFLDCFFGNVLRSRIQQLSFFRVILENIDADQSKCFQLKFEPLAR